MGNHRSLYLLLLSVVVIWGSTFAVIKTATLELSPLLIAFCRAGLASLCFGITLVFLGKDGKLHKEDVPLFFLLGLIGVSVFMPLQAFGAALTYASHCAVLIALSPVMTFLIAWGMGNQKINWRICLGLSLAFSGVALLAIPSGNAGSGSDVLLGDALILLSGFFWSCFSLLGIRIMKKYSPLVAVAYVHIFGFLQLGAYILIQPDSWAVYSDQLSKASLSTWICLGYLAVFASYYSFFIWYRGIEIIGPVKTTTFQYLSPLCGGIVAIVFLGEALTLYLLGAGVLIIGGVWLVNRNK